MRKVKHYLLSESENDFEKSSCGKLVYFFGSVFIFIITIRIIQRALH